MITKRSGTDELVWNEQKRHKLIQVLSDNQRLAERLIVDTSAGRWHVALTALRRGFGEGKPGQAFARFISGMVGSVDNAYTDFLEDIKVAGHGRNVLVSWAFDSEALKREVTLVRNCLDHAGILDESAFKDVHLSGSVDVEAIGAKVSYDNAKHELGVGLHVKLGNMLKAIGINVGGELDADWKTILPHRDSRENLLAALISIESQSGAADVTCRNILEIKRQLSATGNDLAENDRKFTTEKRIPAMKEYLLKVLESMEPEIRRAVDSTGEPLDEEYYLLFNGAITSTLSGNYEGAFAKIARFESAYMPLQRAIGPNVYLMAGAIYLLAEVDTLEREGAKLRLNQGNAHQAQETVVITPLPPARPRMRR